MSELNTFSGAAKGLARNPLGIIALFIVLIYGFAALTLGINRSLDSTARMPLIWFMVVFPFIVLAMFAWLVRNHHEKLYAPADYKTDEGFLMGVEARVRHTQEIQAQQEELKVKVRQQVLASNVGQQGGEELANQLAEEIERSTTFKIDARTFLEDDAALYTFPIVAFETLNELNDEVFFKLSPNVKPYEYGYSWVLENSETNTIIRNARMLVGAPAGKPIADDRSLSEVGIKAGSTLRVITPPRTRSRRPRSRT
jgi:hypothetical protein